MRLLRNITKASLFLLGVLFGLTANAQDLGEPAITIKTQAYAEQGAANTFSILIGATEKSVYFDVDMGFGTEEFEAGYATYDADSAVWRGSVLHARVSGEGVIKIYGDPTKIDVFNAIGCAITEIDLSRCVNLDILNLEHNYLQGLDLTPNSKLRAIYLSDNPGTQASPIIIGGPKPDLQILEMDIVEWPDPNFTPNYPSLRSLDLYATSGIKSLDLSGCPKLSSLVLEMTSVDTLDLTPVSQLTHLNVSESRIRTLDLSKTPYLQRLLCGHSSGTVNTDIKFGPLDLSKNPNLVYLAAQGNNLTSLDISKNTYLRTLYVQSNELTSLDITANPDLMAVDIKNNRLTFSNIPAERSTFTEYYYNQKPYKVKRAYAAGQEIDFSCMLREGSDTYVRVMKSTLGGNPEEVDSTGYTWAGGKLTFNTTYTDSVYVEFANTELASYTLTSTPFKVKTADAVDLPTEIVKLMMLVGKPVNFKVGVQGATVDKPGRVLVDFGNGEKKELAVTSETADTQISGTSAGFYVRVYLPEGEVLTALDLDSLSLLSLDVTAATELRSLSARNCNLTAVNLANNRCLEWIDLTSNKLSKLDLTGVTPAFEKNVMTSIKAANNKIATFTIVNTRGCEYLDLSGNLITELPLKDYDRMRHLDVSRNAIAGEVNISYLAAAEVLDFSNNNITTFVGVGEMPSLTRFAVEGNRLTLATLPRLAKRPANFTYAPQASIAIAEKAPSVNLSSQYVTLDGNATEIAWIKSDGTPLTRDTDYTIKEGITRFITTTCGPVYAAITHSAYPDFTGDNVLRTSAVIPMGAPTVKVATFTITGAGATPSIGFTTSKLTNIYVDWVGDRQDFASYPANVDFSSNEVTGLRAGDKATVYTYDDPAEISVFSVRGIAMSHFDGSPMTALTTLGLYDTELSPDSIVYPNKSTLRELNIEGASLTTIDLSEFPALQHTYINRCQLESIDLSKAPKLQTAGFGHNKITNVKFGNPELWGLDLTGNQLETLDLNGLSAMEQLVLTSNKLSRVDFTPVRSTLRALVLVDNRFTFATLPLRSQLPALGDVYYYGRQAAVDVEVRDNTVDLSAMALIGGAATTFDWYYGEISTDADTGEIVGELMASDGDSPEYSLSGGITKFLVNYDEPVICVMTNETFPSLRLTTKYLDISGKSGIDSIDADTGANSLVDVYSLQGTLVRRGVARSQATRDLAPGLYIVGGKKVLVRR